MCLVICSKILNYLPTSTYDLNQKSNSAPPILSIRRHRVSHVIATATNPSKSVSPIDGIVISLCMSITKIGLTEFEQSVLPRLQCKLSGNLLPKSVPPSLSNRSHRVYLTNSLERLLPNRSHRVCVIGLTEITLCPNPNRIGPTELHVGPTENPNGH